jgi:hypothetical protein
MDVDKYRAEVQGSNEADRMSDKSIQRLRQGQYEEKIFNQNNDKFAYALTQIAPSPENLHALVARCSGSPLDLERRVHKLLYWIQARGYRLGHEIYYPWDVTFLSELSPSEAKMSDTQFLAHWKVRKIVAPLTDGPPPRQCALGRKCLKAVHGKAATIVGTGEYCSMVCRGRAKIIARKATLQETPEPA